MKKIYILLLLTAGIAVQMSAQQMSIGRGTAVHTAFTHSSDVTTDTLRPPSYNYPCDTVDYYYNLDGVPPNDTVYDIGNNIYGETECAQRYLSTGSVTEVLAFIAYKNGTTDSVYSKIYSVLSTGFPGSVLGTSQKRALASISTSAFTVFNF